MYTLVYARNNKFHKIPRSAFGRVAAELFAGFHEYLLLERVTFCARNSILTDLIVRVSGGRSLSFLSTTLSDF